MATILSFLSGDQITDSDGAPVAGALLYHYQAGTTNNLTVYQNAAGTTPHAQPVECDAGGFVPLIYIDDSSAWKVVITDADEVTLRTYDNLPAAQADESATGFAPSLLQWTQVTSAASPVALTAADAGKAYEADTTSGNIEFDLPSAASVGNGKGFLFKKVVAANSMVIDPNGSETIDNSATSITITTNNTVCGIFSNGAEWYRVDGYLDAIQMGALLPGFQSAQVFTGSGTYTLPAGIQRILVISTGSGGGGGAGDGTDSAFGAAGAGGGAGATCIEVFTAAEVGASQTVTIGAAGTAGANPGGTGGTGGNVTFGALHTAGGGGGGQGSTTDGASATTGGLGGTATGGLLNISGGGGHGGVGGNNTNNNTGAITGAGGSSFWGGGGRGIGRLSTADGATAGAAGAAYGSGGGGGGAVNSGTAAGGAGAAGIVFVLEFGS